MENHGLFHLLLPFPSLTVSPLAFVHGLVPLKQPFLPFLKFGPSHEMK
jgi:hypothetical protein